MLAAPTNMIATAQTQDGMNLLIHSISQAKGLIMSEGATGGVNLATFSLTAHVLQNIKAPNKERTSPKISDAYSAIRES